MGNDKIRIAWVSGSLSGGGAERFTVTMANALCRDKDYEFYLLTGKKREKEYDLKNEVNRECVLSETSFFKDVLSLKKYFINNKIDIVVGIGIYANLCLCLANVHLKTKVIISERNAPKQDHLSWKTKLLRWLLYRKADGYVFQTEQAKQCYSARIQRKSVVIHNPVRGDLPHRIGGNSKEIVAVGRLMPQKNYPMLLHAFQGVHQRHADYILRIFGEGHELEKLQTLSTELGIQEFVRFEGFCGDVHECIKGSDIFVMSSDFEGMPNSLMEAMAMGFPVVCTDCPAGGPAELIEDRENGMLTSVGDVEGLKERLVYLIEHEDEKVKMGQRAELIRDTHSVEKIVEQWKRILK